MGTAWALMTDEQREQARAGNARYRVRHATEIKKREAERRRLDPERHRERDRERAARWRERHPEYGAEYQRKKRAADPEADRAYQRAWYRANRERCLESMRRWQRRNPEKAAAFRIRNKELVYRRTAEYIRRHPEKKAAYDRTTRARRKLSIGADRITAEEWAAVVAWYDGRCAYCDAAGKMTMDHVVPLALGGKHAVENVVPACKTCNGRKGDRLWTPMVPGEARVV